jgi:transcriptional regulator with XRE-family HTH domain
MGTTKSAVSRLEGVGKHFPSISILRKYARAAGCELRVSLMEDDSFRRGSPDPR